MLQQELYSGFEYHELTPFFHAFEMSKYICGLSFCSEEEARNFAEQVRYCMGKSPQEIVEVCFSFIAGNFTTHWLIKEKIDYIISIIKMIMDSSRVTISNIG